MEIQRLSNEVISKIRSTSNINNLTQCITELVLNSLDAKSSAIAIRLNSVSFKIQVVDNGIGISQDNLEKLGQKYSTSKCNSLSDLERKPKVYGYRGESLWSISNVSKTCIITTKSATSESTFSKSINFGKQGPVILEKNRQSNGTTVTIDGLFHNLPVRQKRMKKEFEFEEIIYFLKSMSIIHPQISITLRNDISGKLLFKRPKSENVMEAFTHLYPDITLDDTSVMKVRKDKISIEALLLKGIFKEKLIQHIYVNKRPVCHPRLQSFICKELTKNKKKEIQSGLHPTFIFNIKCFLSTYTVIYENSEAKVEFLNIDMIYRCIEKLIQNFLGKSKQTPEIEEVNNNRKSVCGVSDLVGAVKGFGFKDWLKNNESNVDKSGVIEDENEHNEFQMKNSKRTKVCVMNGAKLKSLPIQIRQQETNKSNKSKCRIEDAKKKQMNYKCEQEIQNTKERAMMNNLNRLEKNCKDIILKQKHEDTLFSNFSNTEEKGKDLLMYMFLKSTEIFNRDTSEMQTSEIYEDHPYEKLNTSIETIMESNIFFQNITTTKNHKLNENISVSVTLKRRKKIESHFADDHSLVRSKKKQKTENLIGKDNYKQQTRIFLTSPYFAKKKFDQNSRDTGSIKQDSTKNCRSYLSNNIIDRNILITKKYGKNNSKYIEHGDSRKFSVRNFHFLDLTRKIFSEENNKSYLFNFENIGEERNYDDEYWSEEKLNVGNGQNTKLTLYEWNNNLSSENFDFKNLPFSPIPKFLIPPGNTKRDGKSEIKPSFANCSGTGKTTWRNFISDGHYDKSTKKIFNYDTSRNTIGDNCSKKIFRKYHTEPFDNSKLYHIQRMKKNIDTLFLYSKTIGNREHEIPENLDYSKKKNGTEIFSGDSLESARQIETTHRTPLWQKFIKNRKRRIEMNENCVSPAKRKNKNIGEIPVRTSEHLKTRFPENIESPDMFADSQNFANVHDLTFLPNSAFSIEIDNNNDEGQYIIQDLRTLTAVDTAKSSNLIITVDAGDVKETGRDANSSSRDANIPEDEWIKKFDFVGNEFYFNERTGMTSFFHPNLGNIYALKERLKMIPKGFSPVLVPNQKLEKSLSPVSKGKLHEAIVKSYVEDLGVVKWEKYIQGCDTKKFFENLFKEKVNEYEKEIPNIITTRMSKLRLKNTCNLKFSRAMLKEFRVIGQLDQKFIVVVDRKKNNLIVLDQHAVHERIRLEDLVKEYEGKSSTSENVTLFMNETDLEHLKIHQSYMNRIGFHFHVLRNGITINKIPFCFQNKISREFPLPKLLQLSIREILDMVKNTRGVLTGFPKMMNRIINMEACRGSVKFGEFLAQAEMEKLVENLSRCILPFQCAHGRPTMVPLITLEDFPKETLQKPKLRNLTKGTK